MDQESPLFWNSFAIELLCCRDIKLSSICQNCKLIITVCCRCPPWYRSFVLAFVLLLFFWSTAKKYSASEPVTTMCSLLIKPRIGPLFTVNAKMKTESAIHLLCWYEIKNIYYKLDHVRTFSWQKFTSQALKGNPLLELMK